ncbi:hypothetical protein [Verrucosispora sp. NA02020]|uniref:hypothetical protein n=1 Tax=Verrucosispora sp. NA02020 TaxID=2742132 RepID=UPI001590B65B|nr:hypothetical protein [Verrucosispora sp. NA02020]QKW12205.1 hypothetical protein HUT12_04935 [Verrucosispora sp. NA02020]
MPYGTNTYIHKVHTVRAWLAALAERGVASGALFRRIDKHGQLGRAPHGRATTDGRISSQTVAIVVQRTPLAARVDTASAYAGHPLRRGFATKACRAGHDQIRIGWHGGWKDDSPTLASSIKDIARVTSSALTGIGLGSRTPGAGTEASQAILLRVPAPSQMVLANIPMTGVMP